VVEHFFVSYSRADAAHVGPDLADRFLAEVPSYRLWVDVRELDPGDDWDDQIEDAIKESTGLLLVMTADSVRRGSGCKYEWVWALKCKKPVIPLRFAPAAGLPFRLSSRQYIDFTDSLDQGVARLRIFMGELHQPKGELRELQFRLADAERDLPRALDDAQRARVERDVGDLRRRIVELEGVAADPAGAATATEKRIAAGLEGVRQPARPEPEMPARARFVNPPPLTAPTYFQDRHVETELLAGFLAEPAVRLVTVVGRGGVGKTAMVCRLLKGLESGRLPDELGEQTVDGIVYLRTPSAHPVNFGNLFADLCRLLPTETADRLGQRYHDPHETPTGLMAGLLEAFPADQTVLVLLDNFEELLDNTGTVTDTALDEGLRTLLAAPAHGVKVIVTTRVAPQSLLLHQPGGQRRIDLDEGLPSPYAEAVLRARDPDGRLGLQTASDEVLGVLRERTRGYPRALEAVAAILSADRNTNLDELLAETERLPDNVVEALVGEAFQRLDALTQQVIQALAIFSVPVPAVAVDYLLQPFQPAINAAPVLARLVNMQFVRRDAGRYYLHQVDRDYALGRVPAGDPADRDADPPPFTQYGLWDRAADYFTQTQTPRQEWKTLDDLAPQLAEFELRYQGEDYDTAAQVLLTIDFDYLFQWGHYRYVIGLHTRLQHHLTDPQAIAASKTNLGSCHLQLGDYPRAIELYEQALTIAQENGDRDGEAAAVGNLGNCYAALGQAQRAIDLYEQALTIARETGYRAGEANHVGNLGGRYYELGDYPRAIDLYEQALTIDREIGNRQGEAPDLNNLGLCYAALGQTQQAIELHQQALTIDREIGYRSSEANALNNLGVCEADLGRWGRAAEQQRQAAEVADAIGATQGQAEARRDLAWTLLYAGDLPAAAQAAQDARRHPYPLALAGAALVSGIIHLRQGATPAAEQAFHDAVGHSDQRLATSPQDYDALDTKALALAGLTLTGGIDDTSAAAVAAFNAARTITTASGITARVLRRLNTLTPADPRGTLQPLHAAATGDRAGTVG
jgi:tetratricopeptide (TPR) repeat protein